MRLRCCSMMVVPGCTTLCCDASHRAMAAPSCARAAPWCPRAAPYYARLPHAVLGCPMLCYDAPRCARATPSCARAAPVLRRTTTALPCRAVPSCTALAPRSEEVKPARKGSCWKVRPEWLIGKAELGLVADGSCWGRTRVQLPGLPPPATLSLPGSCAPSPSPWDTALLPPRPRPSHEWAGQAPSSQDTPLCPISVRHLPSWRGSYTDALGRAGCSGPCEARGTRVLIPTPQDARGTPQARQPPLLGQGNGQNQSR